MDHMSFPDLHYNIYPPEENFQAYLRRVSIRIENILLELTNTRLDNIK